MRLTPNDRLEIERLYVSYNRAIHGANAEAWAECFTANGVFSNRARTVEGHDALRAYAESFSADRAARYVINNLVVDESAAGATGTCYLVILREHGEGQAPAIDLTGIYSDRLVLDSGSWKYASRHIQRDL